MTAFYNEIDPFAAAWLRELAVRDLIAIGTVCDRSIVDLQPADVEAATQLHCFAGIGVWSYALRLAGWPDAVPIWTGSCPCQPFSRPPAARKAFLMTDTSGPRGSSSSSSAALQSSLASKLRALTEGAGSTLFSLTWKDAATPSGRPICRLAASVRRTSDSVCISWPSPTVNDAKGSAYSYANGDHDWLCLKLVGAARQAVWPGCPDQLQAWPTASARDWKSSASNKHGQGKGRPLNEVARLSIGASWPTTRRADGKSGGKRIVRTGRGFSINDGSLVDHLMGDAGLEGGRRHAGLEGGRRHAGAVLSPQGGSEGERIPSLGISLTSLSLQAQTALPEASGETPTTSPVAIPSAGLSTGQLNPAHSRWLMGLRPRGTIARLRQRPRCASRGDLPHGRRRVHRRGMVLSREAPPRHRRRDVRHLLRRLPR